MDIDVPSRFLAEQTFPESEHTRTVAGDVSHRDDATRALGLAFVDSAVGGVDDRTRSVVLPSDDAVATERVRPEEIAAARAALEQGRFDDVTGGVEALAVEGAPRGVDDPTRTVKLPDDDRDATTSLQRTAQLRDAARRGGFAGDEDERGTEEVAPDEAALARAALGAWSPPRESSPGTSSRIIVAPSLRAPVPTQAPPPVASPALAVETPSRRSAPRWPLLVVAAALVVTALAGVFALAARGG